MVEFCYYVFPTEASNMMEYDPIDWIWLNMTEYDYDWIWLNITITGYDSDWI